MKDRGPTVARWLASATALILLGLALLPLSPAYPSNPNRDAGVFLYAGQAILDGAVPYRDVWDHKPPLIFFINAVGLSFLPSWWGVWWLEVAFAIASIVLTWKLVEPRWGNSAALMACAVWICSLFLFSIGGRGGNLTEEYALPLQFGALLLWSRSGLRSFGANLLLGVLCSAVALLKPPLIGIWIAAAIVEMIVRTWRSTLRTGLQSAVGVAIPLALFGLYFAYHGATADALDQVLHYNAVYSSGGTWATRVGAALFGLKLLWASGGAVALLYWPISLVRGWRTRHSDPLLLIAAIDLAIEIALASMPGRTYEHYFLSALPAVALLSAAALAHLFEAIPQVAPRTRVLLATLGTLLLLASPLSEIRGAVMTPRAYPHALVREMAVRFVRQTTGPNDRVLVWGAEASVNFLAARRSPTRYVYLHPLMTTGYADDRRVAEFISDLERRQPAIILDSSPTESLFIPLTRPERARWVPWAVYTPPPSMMRAVSWVEEHYVVAGRLPSGWRVLVPRDRRLDPRIANMRMKRVPS